MNIQYKRHLEKFSSSVVHIGLFMASNQSILTLNSRRCLCYFCLPSQKWEPIFCYTEAPSIPEKRIFNIADRIKKFIYCLSQNFCYCNEILCPKTNWGGKHLFPFTVPHSSPLLREVKAGTQERAETEVEIVEECCLLACSLWLAQVAFCCIQGHQLKGETSCCQLILPTSNINPENESQTCKEGKSGWGVHSLHVSSSKMRLACIKLT